jgi:DedD protein
MEEKNELNDIILNKSGSGSNSKKLLLAIAALTLILIVVLVIMNSLKTQSDEQPPKVVAPPMPTAPTEIVADPLFEPVEVIQEGSGNTSAPAQTQTPQDLGKIAQKIKQESFQNTPAQSAPTTIVQQNTPVQQVKPVSAPAPQSAPVQQTKSFAAAPVAAKTVMPAIPTSITKTAPVVENKAKAAAPIINTPTIKSTAPVEVKKAIEPKKAVAVVPTKQTPAPTQKVAEKPAEKAVDKSVVETAAKPVAKAADTAGTYYIQVGSFSKQPNQALFDRINASGLKYITAPNGASTKVMIGPFQGDKAARDVLGTVKRNIESGAYITKG